MLLEKPVGILGGTFDPIHEGHLHIASIALRELQLNEIKFIPCYQPVHRDVPKASPADRKKMVELAIHNCCSYTLDQRELQRPAPSYTIDTLITLRVQFPTTPFCLIMGSDSYLNIETWKRWQELLDFAHFIVLHRPGFTLKSNPTLRENETKDIQKISSQLSGSIILMEVTPCPISSTTIREKIKRQEDISRLVPSPVAEYIKVNKLYQF